jgi:hypothetical protein
MSWAANPHLKFCLPRLPQKGNPSRIAVKVVSALLSVELRCLLCYSRFRITPHGCCRLTLDHIVVLLERVVKLRNNLGSTVGGSRNAVTSRSHQQPAASGL